ncbi:MAG: hypothetical protein J6Y03_06195 [Alphaproteobacteria bacterium]|nr:hypothetical protein [Alphaproteobacteria bacterium]
MNKKLLTSVVASGLLLCSISNKAESAERSPHSAPKITRIFIGQPQAPQQNVPVTNQKIIMKSASRTIIVNTKSTTPVTIVKEQHQKGRTIIKKEPNKITIIEQRVRADQKTR